MIKIYIFDLKLNPVGEYHSEHVPREGETIIYGDKQIIVETVTWEDVNSEPTVQIRGEVDW